MRTREPVDRRAQGLRQAEALHKRAVTRLEKARAQRDELVRSAFDAGWTYQRIGEAMGLSKQRVHQILVKHGEGETTELKGWTAH